MPALLRAARGAYAHAMSRRLAAGGFDDLPRNGPSVLGGITMHGGSLTYLVQELAVSKQAASQLIDSLAQRGYLERNPDPTDRRRISLHLTDRGRRAFDAVLAGIAEVDGELAARLSPEDLRGLRKGLAELTAIHRLTAQCDP